LGTDNNFLPRFYLSDAAEWIFQEATNNHVSHDMLERLQLCAQDIWDPKSIPAQGWLYSRLIDACRRGNLEIIGLLVDNFLHGIAGTSAKWPQRPKDAKRGNKYQREHPECWSQICGHLMVEAAAGNQQKIVDFLRGKIISVVKWWGEWAENPVAEYHLHLRKVQTFTEYHRGGVYNALERAALAGNCEIVTNLLESRWEATELLNNDAKAAIRFLAIAVNEGQT
jgi:hypothetical protein